MGKQEKPTLIERLKSLEYVIRKSITVREDQEDDADRNLKEEAELCGVRSANLATKGDLLNAVQTAVRSEEAMANKNRFADRS